MNLDDVKFGDQFHLKMVDGSIRLCVVLNKHVDGSITFAYQCDLNQYQYVFNYNYQTMEPYQIERNLEKQKSIDLEG